VGRKCVARGWRMAHACMWESNTRSGPSVTGTTYPSGAPVFFVFLNISFAVYCIVDHCWSFGPFSFVICIVRDNYSSLSWNKFHKNLPRDNFKIFFWKNVVLYEIYSKKSKVTNTYVHWLCIQSQKIGNPNQVRGIWAIIISDNTNDKF
jgi:hypothetical protein